MIVLPIFLGSVLEDVDPRYSGMGHGRLNDEISMVDRYSPQVGV